MPSPKTPPVELDASFVHGLCRIFEEQIVFNTVIGLKVTDIRSDGVAGEIRMRPELIGHFSHQRLHGGVVSAGLDALGGLAVMAALGARHADETPEHLLQRFNKLGTIDLRVDYLRPSKGARFTLRAETLRLGSRVATTHMSFHGEDDLLLAVATGAYIVS
ncbi:MAG: thioesterase family protein [Burkholderiaceae bacterium]